MTTTAPALSAADLATASDMICNGFPRTWASNSFYGGPVATAAQRNALRAALATTKVDAETVRLVRGYFNHMFAKFTAYEASCGIRILRGETPVDQTPPRYTPPPAPTAADLRAGRV